VPELDLAGRQGHRATLTFSRWKTRLSAIIPPVDACWNEPLATRAVNRIARARIRVGHEWQRLKGAGSGSGPTVVGCYNTSNVGDSSFATVLKALSAERGAGFDQASYGAVSPSQWSRPLLIGGGGLLNGQVETPLTRLLLEPRRSRTAPLAMVSIATSYGVAPLRDELKAALSSARLLAVRDSVTANWLQAELPGAAVVQHPDIAFLLPELAGWRAPARQAGTIGINIMPVLMERTGGAWRPKKSLSAAFHRASPRVAAQGTATAEAYLSIVRQTVIALVQRGHRVVHVPFAMEDDGLARALLQGTGIAFNPFSEEPHRVLTAVASCEGFIATRFHGHVFALATGTPLHSLPYSDKCSLLLSDLGLPPAPDEPADWAQRTGDAISRLQQADAALSLPQSRRTALAAAARGAATRAIFAVAE
jgi:polysaccharide pyruvyl transferase WcaK-like protein